MKNKFLSKILISVVMIGIFMLPIAPSIKTNNVNFTAKITLNEIKAQNEPIDPNKKVLQEETDETTINGISLNCGITNIGGCVAWLFYIVFKVAALFAKLAAYFLDFMVYYSINSSSYTNGFISAGWSAIRDVANMFFIIALLYVAIKTILGLNVTDNKKMIGYVIVVALLLNFSLFTTKVVIDATNILAKIFYNGMPSVDENGAPLALLDGDGKPMLGEDGKPLTQTTNGGERSLSLGLVDKYNPQKLMTQDAYDKKGGVASFIFLTCILIGIVLYTAYIFFIVGMLFVSRVASLWILMIFSPIAFASYTVPFDIPGFGHKEWWSELLKNAFLAPIFIFFLYLIILFAGFLKGITSYPPGASIFQNIMSVIIPCIILFILLMKSKELAVKYSGEMGAAFIKGGQMIGGLALGAVTGGAAMLGTKGLGGLAASQLAKNGENWKEKAKESGFGGWAARMKLRTADYGSKATYDARQTKLGSQFTKTTGMNLGSASVLELGTKTGGYKGAETRSADKIMNKADLYKTKMSDKEVQAWSNNRMAKFNEEKDKARKASKGPFDEAKYDKEHNKPKEYTSAGQLNTDRLKSYTENFAKRQLFSKVGNKEATKRLTKTVEEGEKIQGKKDKSSEARKIVEAEQAEIRSKKSKEEAKLSMIEEEAKEKAKNAGKSVEEYLSSLTEGLKTSMDDLSNKEKSIVARKNEIEKQIDTELKKAAAFGNPADRKKREEEVKKLEMERNTLQAQETSVKTEFALKLQEHAKLNETDSIKNNIKQFEKDLVNNQKEIERLDRNDESLKNQSTKLDDSTKVKIEKPGGGESHPTPAGGDHPKEHKKEEPPHSAPPSGGGAHGGGHGGGH